MFLSVILLFLSGVLPRIVRGRLDLPAADLEQPRLSIAHILVWTVGSAVVLALFRGFGNLAQVPVNQRAFLLTWILISSAVSGAAVSSVGLFMTMPIN